MCIIIMVVNLSLNVQGKRKNPPNPNKPPPPHPELPIDAGLSYLLIVGMIVGVYELKRKD